MKAVITVQGPTEEDLVEAALVAASKIGEHAPSGAVEMGSYSVDRSEADQWQVIFDNPESGNEGPHRREFDTKAEMRSYLQAFEEWTEREYTSILSKGPA